MRGEEVALVERLEHAARPRASSGTGASRRSSATARSREPWPRVVGAAARRATGSVARRPSRPADHLAGLGVAAAELAPSGSSSKPIGMLIAAASNFGLKSTHLDQRAHDHRLFDDDRDAGEAGGQDQPSARARRDAAEPSCTGVAWRPSIVHASASDQRRRARRCPWRRPGRTATVACACIWTAPSRPGP